MSTSKRKAPEPAYHHGDLRRALVDAAAKIVAREGAAAVTLREVARLAGVSHNAPYRHFESLAALLAAVATEGFEAFRDCLQTAAGNASAARRMKALGKAYVDFALDNPRLYLLMFGPDLDKAAHPQLHAAAQQAFAVLKGETGKSDGNTHTQAVGAWAFVHGLAHLIIDKQIKRSDPAIAELFDRA
jgi:AcrR family transcriptional regulator